MRSLTDAEDAQLKTKYPKIWMSTVYRPRIVTEEPLILQLFVLNPRTNLIGPIQVMGFDIDLDDSPQQGEYDGSGQTTAAN